MNATTRLVQFTDSHLFTDPDGELRGVPSLASLRATVDAARSTLGSWDGTLLTGDLVQDDPGGYAHIRAVFGNTPHAVHCLPGNHDVPDAMRRELAAPPFRHDGAARYGGWLVVLLDSTVAGCARGALSPRELARLDDLLRDGGYEHALVCLHHQPIGMESRWLDHVGLENAAQFLAVIDAHPRVRALLWGHVHQAYDGRRGDVRLLGTPSTCAQFRPRVDAFAIDAAPPAYRWLELDAAGGLRSGLEWVPAPLASAAIRSA